jgi:hypothetical protein
VAVTPLLQGDMVVRMKNEEINCKRMKAGKTASAFCILHSFQQRHRSCRRDCRRTPKIPQMRRKSLCHSSQNQPKKDHCSQVIYIQYVAMS